MPPKWEIPFAERWGIECLIKLCEMSLFVLVWLGILWLMFRIMREKGFRCRLAAVLPIGGIYAALTYLCGGGFGIFSVKGMFLFCVLLYASCSDLTDHTAEDFLWVILLALALVNPVSITSALVGAAVVFIPQMAIALISPKKAMGGADIKMSTAMALGLGAVKGVAALCIGLVLAVVVTLILRARSGKENDGGVAMLPYLSAGALLFYLI